MSNIAILTASAQEFTKIQGLLQAASHTVEACVTSKQLWEVLTKGLQTGKAVDLVLIDASLKTVSDDNGFKVCKDVRRDERFKSLPTILFLDDERGGKFWAREHGATGVLIKPFHQDALLDTIERVLPKSTRK